MLFAVKVGNMTMPCGKAKSNTVLFAAFFSFALLGTTIITTPSLADDSYRWLDPSGNVVYGSNPPKNAKSVRKLRKTTLSRYSSDKVLKSMGWSSNGPEGSNQKQKTTAAPQLLSASLEPDDVQLEVDGEGAVSSCRVSVKNTGQTDAIEISVAFEFSDGTLVPGVGPEEIKKSSSAVYEIPSELLPLRLQVDEVGDRSLHALKPKVIVHGAGE